MPIQKFWKDMAVTAMTPTYCYIMRTAREAIPWFHQIVYHQINVQQDCSKTKVMQNIGQYLSKSKHTVKIICEYLYSISGSQKAVTKREHVIEPGDLLDFFKFFRMVGVATNVTKEIRDSAALAITSSFQSISEPYTYTLYKDENECMQIDDGPIDDIDAEHNSRELLIDNTDAEVNLLTIT
jgi:hypothetical protein